MTSLLISAIYKLELDIQNDAIEYSEMKSKTKHPACYFLYYMKGCHLAFTFNITSFLNPCLFHSLPNSTVHSFRQLMDHFPRRVL